MMLPPSPVAAFCDSHGILLRREAVLMGIDDNLLARLVDQKALVRLRQGAYCLREVFKAADAAERHRLLVRAVMKQYGEHVALSHASSCIAQGGPSYGLNLSSVHLTHLTGGGRRLSRIRHHKGECLVGDLRRQDGHWITVPARAVAETACIEGAEAGLVQANHFLHTGETTLDELRQVMKGARHWPGSLSHHVVMHLADGRVESVGESRSTLVFWSQGLPAPVSQFEITYPDGRVAARVDFAWPEHKVIVEFDGMTKYHRYRRPGETIEQVVIREKLREDLIRELTGWTVIRLVWSDLETPVRTAARIRRAFAAAAAAA